MRLRILILVIVALGACAPAPEDVGVDVSALGVPSCNDVDLAGVEVTVTDLGGESLLVSAGGVPVCMGSDVEVRLALDRNEDDGDDGTPLPAADGEGEGDKKPDELPGTPLPAATE
jgi:hypothetical protein